MTNRDRALVKSFAEQLAERRLVNEVVGYMAVAERIEQVCPHLIPYIQTIKFFVSL